MTDDYFDFGFTAVTEDELETVRNVQEEQAQLKQQLQQVDSKSKSLYDAIMPLLENLKQNPEKDYIYWPNRYEKIDQFQDKLSDIMNS